MITGLKSIKIVNLKLTAQGDDDRAVMSSVLLASSCNGDWFSISNSLPLLYVSGGSLILLTIKISQYL